ncbi:hypothetical protein, partial [Leisingera sp. ANG-M1]|uniref:hypothetical protein n=1 Tax=Leisingera sp. ANG-M1 TaxID=1577895 RepID=UPI0019D32A49
MASGNVCAETANSVPAVSAAHKHKASAQRVILLALKRFIVILKKFTCKPPGSRIYQGNSDIGSRNF